jgi:CRP/FNR family transcriptional regulator, anaerobic regulatory protein
MNPTELADTADAKSAALPISMRGRLAQACVMHRPPPETRSQSMNPSIQLHNGRPPGNVALFPPVQGSVGERNTMADLLRLMGTDDLDVRGAATIPVPVRRLHAGESLFHEGARAESIYFVRSGTFKVFRTAEDGYEQVLGFVGRAEVIGFDALCSDGHPTESVALEDSTVYALPVRDLFGLAERSPALSRVVHRAASSALTRQGELADVMAAVAAEVRLARFLLHLSQQMAACGQSPRRFVLRMSRRDIASYLGVAHETVSRSFTALAGWGMVTVDNREVGITDMAALRAFSRSTRRQIDEASRSGIAHSVATRAVA